MALSGTSGRDAHEKPARPEDRAGHTQTPLPRGPTLEIYEQETRNATNHV